jgi:putative tricarboxylic transport membrane protein
VIAARLGGTLNSPSHLGRSLIELGQLFDGLIAIANPSSLGMIFLGVVVGVIVGAIPGLTTSMAMALAVPVTFFMPPLLGIPFLVGLYKGGVYGGSIPAILIATPGTGAAVATVADGYALTKKGKGKLALHTALYASVMGDFLSDIVFIVFIAQLVLLVRYFGPPEYFAIFVFSLMIISLSAGSSPAKGLLSAALGLLLSVVGTDTAGQWRFTFGVVDLVSGFAFVPLLIGLFAFSVIIENIANANTQESVVVNDGKGTGENLSWLQMKSLLPTVLRSTGIGILIGAIPGIGQPVAAMLGYSAAQRFSKHPEEFGKGSLEGVAGPEAANNAVNGPSLIPLFTFGIPGDIITSVMLGAFMAHGLRPGADLFVNHGDTMYAILMGMVLANGFVVIVGLALAGQIARVVTLPRYLLLPSVVALAVIGAYAVNNSVFDVGVMAAFGFVGYVMRRQEIPMAPLVITLLLSHEMENSLIRTLIVFRGDLFGFADRPIALVLLALTFLLIGLSLYSTLRRKPRLLPSGE